MATGQLPFRGDTSGMIFHAILERRQCLPCGSTPKFRSSSKKSYKSLEKDATCATQHASEMRADLQRMKRDTEFRPCLCRCGSVAGPPINRAFTHATGHPQGSNGGGGSGLPD